LARAIFGDPEKVELKQVTAKSRIPLLQAGEIDLLIANFTVTEERKKVLDFGKPHLNLPYWIVVPKDSPYQTLPDLNGKRIGEIKGAEFVGDALKAKLSKAEIVYFDSHPELALALVSKRLDAIEAAGFASLTALEAHPNLRRFKIDLDLPENLAAGFRKDQPEFVAFWNDLLDRLAANGTLKQIFVKNMPPRMELSALPFDIK
jgi:putative glutamine transport system substrate-binding protein